MTVYPAVPIEPKRKRGNYPFMIVQRGAENAFTGQAVVLSKRCDQRAPRNYMGRPVTVITYLVSHSDGRLWHVTTKQEALRIFNKLRGEVLS